LLPFGRPGPRFAGVAAAFLLPFGLPGPRFAGVAAVLAAAAFFALVRFAGCFAAGASAAAAGAACSDVAADSAVVFFFLEAICVPHQNSKIEVIRPPDGNPCGRNLFRVFRAKIL
jgi:hypothetical protein